MADNISNINTSINNATQAASRINTLKKSKDFIENSDKIEDVTSKLDDISSSVSDPISASLKKILFKINSISSVLEQKINKLAEDSIKYLDGKGRVEFDGSTIFIIVKPEEVEKASVVQNNIIKNISSINNHLKTLSATLDSLNVLAKTLKTIQTALDIQELLMLTNPATAATFKLSKKIFKVLFLKDILKEHSKLINEQLRENKAIFNKLFEKFKKINVQIKISSEENKGNVINETEASNMLSNELLHNNLEINNLSEEYRNINDKDYLLVVEKYDSEQNIGRAKDKYSGLIVAQTAPSYFSTGQQLLDELKIILDKQ